MKKLPVYLTFVLIAVLAGCATQKVSVIESCQYNETTKNTDYIVLPFGSASIPGKWNKTQYNGISHQQFFVDADSVEIAVAFNRYDKYEFNQNGRHKGMEFVKAFYEWESQYFIDAYKMNREIVEQDDVNKFMIYRIYGKDDGTYFLIGEKNGNASNMSVSPTDKWTADQKKDFLKGLFLQEK